MAVESTSPSLLDSLRGGPDERSWARFLTCYEAMLLSFAKRLGLSDSDACDAVQETLVAVFTLFRSLPEPFDRTKGRFRSWLRGIAKHKVLDLKRARAKHSLAGRLHNIDIARHSIPVESLDGSTDATDWAFDKEWRLNQVAQAIDMVKRESDPVVYQAFFLTFVEKQDAAAVARLLGVSRNAVYVSKCKLLKRVREAVAQIERDED